MLTIWNILLPNHFSSDSFLMIFFDILIQSCFFVVYYCGANDLVIRPFKAKGYSYFFLHIDQYFFITRDVARIRLLSVVTEFERPNQVNYYRNWIESENSVQEAGERAAWEAVLEASGKRYWKRAGSDTGSEREASGKRYWKRYWTRSLKRSLKRAGSGPWSGRDGQRCRIRKWLFFNIHQIILWEERMSVCFVFSQHYRRCALLYKCTVCFVVLAL